MEPRGISVSLDGDDHDHVDGGLRCADDGGQRVGGDRAQPGGVGGVCVDVHFVIGLAPLF